MSVGNEELVMDLAINRPPAYDGFPEFWDAIFEVLRRTPTYRILLGVATHANCCIANPDILTELAADFAEARGGVRFVSSAVELVAALFD